MIRSTLQALLHQATVMALRVLPDERRVPLERRMRGRYDAQRLARSDVVAGYSLTGILTRESRKWPVQNARGAILVTPRKRR